MTQIVRLVEEGEVHEYYIQITREEEVTRAIQLGGPEGLVQFLRLQVQKTAALIESGHAGLFQAKVRLLLN